MGCGRVVEGTGEGTQQLHSAAESTPATYGRGWKECEEKAKQARNTFAPPSCHLSTTFLQEATHRDRVVELERRVTNSRIKLHEQGRKTPVKPTPPATASIGSKAEVQVRAVGR